MLLNLSYYLSTKSYPLGHIIFKEGEDCDFIAIVKQGSFEVSKKLPSNVKDEGDLWYHLRAIDCDNHFEYERLGSREGDSSSP